MIQLRPVVLAIAAMAPVPAHCDVPLWGPHLDIEAKPGSKRTLGEADLFLPLSQDARTLVFGNLRARFDNKTSREGNVGLGVRHMLESGWNLGAYGYADRRRSPDSGHYYNQTTLGAEALGRDWDFRANTYLPSGTRVHELSRSTVVGIPTAALVGTTIQVTTPGNITTTREERSLKGYDMEAGWRAPIFDSEAAHQLRLFVGSYRFSDDTVTVEGPRLRAELAMDDLNWFGKGTRFFVGLEAQHDNVRGHQNFLSLRLRIPLGKESAQPRALSAQERRMTTPVMRDVDVVTNARTVSTTAPTVVETATATAGGQTITVLDSTTTSGAGLQGALDAAAVAAGGGANSTVILSGSFDTGSNTTITLNPGQTLMGRGSLTVRSPSGRTATLVASTGATIASTNTLAFTNITAIDMAAGSTLTGMTLTPTTAASNASVYSVRVNVDSATISNNTITATSPDAAAVGVRLEGAASNVTVSGNTLSISNTNGGGGAAYGVFMVGAPGPSVNLTNNIFSVSANNQYAIYRVTGTITASGNTYLTSAGCSNAGVGMPCP